MQPKFRPIPLSFIDVLGIVVPGFVWLLFVIVAGQQLTTHSSAGPLIAWNAFATEVARARWAGPLAAILVAAAIGYSLKAQSMKLAQLLSLPFFKLRSRTRPYDLHELHFPFRILHEQAGYFGELVGRIEKLAGCSIHDLPGFQPFITAKRLLRLKAPELWEEAEHREAEVRMVGSLFLVSVFSIVLAGAEMVRRTAADRDDVWIWLGTSLLTSIVLGDGFNQLRIREVEYTYLNVIVALNSGRLEDSQAGTDAAQPQT